MPTPPAEFVGPTDHDDDAARDRGHRNAEDERRADEAERQSERAEEEQAT
jgi:hypothetical protein